MMAGSNSQQNNKHSTRLIILLDGTWQTDSGVHPPTNIVKLRDLIKPKNDANEKPFTQFIYYDSGVGTGGSTTRRSWDGATGNGLEDIVRGAYRQICHRYQKGMEIYVFGFSRGAFSARSLVGYLNASGLLTAENCSAVNEKKAWDFYRKPTRYRIPAERKALAALSWTDTPRIACLGVFDTVGARGIPLSLLRSRNAFRYGFHESKLSSIVDYAFHALALDEKRRHYVPTLWSYAFHTNNTQIEQVWFPGCHSDIGGGVDTAGLSNLPLTWMLRRMADNKLGLVLDQEGITKIEAARNPTAPILGNQGLLCKALSIPKAHRSVSQTRPNESDNLFVGLERHQKPLREAVHWSVLTRITADETYRPQNLEHDSFWHSIYVNGTATDTDVVGPDERFLEWWRYQSDYDAMLKILPERKLEEFKTHAAPYVGGKEWKRRTVA